MLLRASSLLAILLFLGCSEPSEPMIYLGDVGVPESMVANLADTEREMFLDLIALGTAIADESIGALGASVIERRADDSRISVMPYHVAAAEQGLSEEALRIAYDSAPEWELDVRHVVLLVEDGAPAERVESARRVADEVALRAAAGEEFAALAAEFSEEPGAAARGGLLQPGRRGSWVEPFWRAAEALRPGEISPVIRTEYGFHVLRLDDRRAVPFAEADRTELLRRLISRDDAAAAMERWAASSGAILLDPPAVAQARAAFVEGEHVPDTLIIANGSAGGAYRIVDAVPSWALLDAGERRLLEQDDEAAFARWLEREARTVVWADIAEDLGARPEQDALDNADFEWRQRVAELAHAFGFAPGQPPDAVRAAAYDGLRSGAAQARAARAELPALRPLLRRASPVRQPEI